MPLYVLQEGESATFKIGITGAAEVERRRRGLNCGRSVGLRVFQVVELEPARELERFLHQCLAHRQVAGDGGTEFFAMQSENHMRAFLDLAVPLFLRRREVLAYVQPLESRQNSGRMLRAAQEDRLLAGQVHALRRRLQDLEEEAVLVRLEVELLEAELKQKIGPERGIEGIATWEARSSRRFHLASFTEGEPALFREMRRRFPKLDTSAWRLTEPQLYREVTARFPELDTALWRAQDRALYEAMRERYFTATLKREFVLL